MILLNAILLNADPALAQVDDTVRIQRGELSPAVVSIRESNPKTPVELVEAISLLLDLKEPVLAGQYFNRLLKLQLGTQAMVKLGRTVGPEPLNKIARTETFQPQGFKFAIKIMQATRAADTSPERIKQLIAKAVDPDRTKRYQATIDLNTLTPECIEPLVRVLADKNRQADHPYIRETLVLLAPVTFKPLLAVLDTKDPALEQNVLRVLAQVDGGSAYAPYMFSTALRSGVDPRLQHVAQRVVRQLAGAVPSRQQAKETLTALAKSYLSGEQIAPSNVDDTELIWQYNDKNRKLTSSALPPRTVHALLAARLAREANEIAPANRRLQRASLLSNLSAARLVSGGVGALKQAKHPVAEAAYRHAASQSLELLEDVLKMALEQGNDSAARAAAEVIADTAKADAWRTRLIRSDRVRAPLVIAAEHPDCRVRLAALQAIVNMNPNRSFPGSSVVPKQLKYLANFSNTPRILVADPRQDQASQLASLASTLDGEAIEPTPCTTGTALYRRAIESPENLFAMIAYTITQPGISDSIRVLRRDPRTARIPIGILIEPRQRFAANRIAEDDPLTLVFVRPRDQKTMDLYAQQLIAAGRDNAVWNERVEVAREAMKLIGTLADRRQSVFDLRGMDSVAETMLETADLSPYAARALSRLGTPVAQQALVRVASSPSMNIEIRKQAALSFSHNIERHGILLTTIEIRHLAALYDASANDDQATQDVLWSLLDAMQEIKKKRPEAKK